MSSGPRCLYLVTLLLTVVSCATPRSRPEATAPAAMTAARGSWLQYADVRQAGFDPEALRAVCEQADRLRSGALMAVFRGHVVLACGDVERSFETHSVRKSLVSGLYGTAVGRGKIDLNATLASFAIDDNSPLTRAERSATIRQVISARSGIYLPAAYAPMSQNSRPARGRYSPGTHWFYNNWDFNVAGVVYERATGEDLYESFQRRVATPLGMEDWNAVDGFRVYEPTKSRHPAHTFRISVRDLARFGQLYLQQGRWEGRQLLPSEWIAESTQPHTDDGDGTGYGYMWWTYQAGSQFTTARYPLLGKYKFYRALGTGEQGLWVIPDAGLVVVHLADTDHSRSVSSEEHWKLVESILAARQDEAAIPPATRPELTPLRPVALSSQLPASTLPVYQDLPTSAVNDYLGDYTVPPGPAELVGRKLTPGGTIKVFLFDRKPYVHLPGVGDLLMFPNGKDMFTARAVLGLAISFERVGDEVTSVTFTFDGRTFSARAVRA
jgi:CubicO group peptidase (beta-lactamase class C family)